MKRNFVTLFDSYKAGHPDLYPEDLDGMYAYFESRGGRYAETVFFGLQYYLQEYLEGQVFTPDDVREAGLFWAQHFGRNDYFNAGRWIRLFNAYGGYLPLEIKAVPEGSLVPTHNVLFTVESIDPEFAWLVGTVETLLMKVWYPITLATQSFDLKRRLTSLRDVYSDSRDGLDFMVHDFGYRGATSEESAAIGGAAHLTSFKGTDTVAGIRLLQQYYDGGMTGFSVPATEHSIILAYSEEKEEDCYRQYLEQFPEGIIACVSDTYDIDNAVRNMWLRQLKDRVMGRQGVLVIRPDSGDPKTIVGNILMEIQQAVGGTFNSKNRMVLDPHYRVIQGDGMDWESIPDLYDHIVTMGYAPENLTIGAGGGMIQKVNRDTQRFAYKVSAVRRYGKWIGVSKHPKTDPSKTSKKGRFMLVDDGSGITTVPKTGFTQNDLLNTVFFNGALYNTQSIDEIRSRLERYL